jgi:tRNA(fMet)-specific endonuclease VapC
MIYLLDTNACIHHLKFPGSPVTQQLRTHLPVSTICAITKSELFYGAMRSETPTQSLKNQQDFLAQLPCLPFDEQAASIHGRIRAQLANQGSPIGPYDSQIASIALAYDLTLITNNVGEFRRVEHLKIEDWQANG